MVLTVGKKIGALKIDIFSLVLLITHDAALIDSISDSWVILNGLNLAKVNLNSHLFDEGIKNSP